MVVAPISAYRTAMTIPADVLLDSILTLMGMFTIINSQTSGSKKLLRFCSSHLFETINFLLQVFMTRVLTCSRICEQTPEKLLLYARKKDIRLKQLNPRKQTDSLDMVSHSSVTFFKW